MLLLVLHPMVGSRGRALWLGRAAVPPPPQHASQRLTSSSCTCHRFAPVKTCSDLFVLRSDAYHITEACTVEPAVPVVPLIKLDDAHYKLVDKMEALTHTTPSLAKVGAGAVEWWRLPRVGVGVGPRACT